VLWLGGTLVAGVLFLLWALLKVTVRVRHTGRPADDVAVSSIECAWHESLLPYFLIRMPYPKAYVWMNHPAWFMKPIHVLLGWMGVQELVLGSSGHGGRAALAALIPSVKAGTPTFLNPDGPYGPAHEVKDGVLDLSIATGVRVLALRFDHSFSIRLPTWDRKFIPLPFSRVDVFYTPIAAVRDDTRNSSRAAIRRALGGFL
jgi:lysophospholipid acyltransferase (LPLAT)-like uncharacterized protein